MSKKAKSSQFQNMISHNRGVAIYLFILFFCLATCILVANVITNYKIQKAIQNGICLDTIVTKVSLMVDSDDERYDVYYAYNYDGTEYFFVDKGSSKKYDVGETVKAYIYPDNPQALIFEKEPVSIGWAIFILAIGIIVSVICFNCKTKIEYEDYG